LQVVVLQPLMAVVDLQVAAALACKSVHPQVAGLSVLEILETIILELQVEQAVVLMAALAQVGTLVAVVAVVAVA
jgi:hypothetical protein